MNIYAAGGVLIFGWRKSSVWPSNGDAATFQTPQKVVDAAAVFQPEGGAEISVCWNNAVVFDVGQDDFHQFLLARRKAAVQASAHDGNLDT